MHGLRQALYVIGQRRKIRPIQSQRAEKYNRNRPLKMRIDFLKHLAPSEYKFRQLVLDTMFRIAKANPNPTCHQDELIKDMKREKEKIETVILYLVRNDYAKHVGNHGDPLYSLTGKGQSASIDREFLRTGRNERYKNVLAYVAWLNLISTPLAITTAPYIVPRMVRLEKRIESMEQHVSQQSQASTGIREVHSSQPEQSLQKVDSVSLLLIRQEIVDTLARSLDPAFHANERLKKTFDTGAQ